MVRHVSSYMSQLFITMDDMFTALFDACSLSHTLFVLRIVRNVSIRRTHPVYVS